MVSTVKKWDSFELRTLEKIKEKVDDGSLWIYNVYAKILWKPKYISRNRGNKKVTFDLSIEIYPKWSTEFNQLWIIECKNYKNLVPVWKIEEFKTKIDWIPLASKWALITNNWFQEWVYDIAKSYWIMLASLNESNEMNIELMKKRINSNNGLDSKIREIISSSLFEANIEWLKKYRKIDFAPIAKKVRSELGYTEEDIIGSDIKWMIKRIKKTYGLNTILEQKDDNTKWYINIKNKTIYLNHTFNERSILFTLCHELGHFILHKDIKINKSLYNSFVDPEHNLENNKLIFNNPKHWIERQANRFAVELCMEERIFKVFFLYYRNEVLNIWNYSYIWRDKKWLYKNRDYFMTIEYLSLIFHTSQESIVLRIEELWLFKDEL